jgi:DNA-binding NarL/FixJ family response regulator
MKPIRVLAITQYSDAARAIRELLDGSDEFDLIWIGDSGRIGITQTRQLVPDLVLVDQDVPDMKALEVIEAINAIVPTAKFVVMSVAMDALMLRKFMEAGVRYTVGIPIHADELMPTMRMLYKK